MSPDYSPPALARKPHNWEAGRRVINARLGSSCGNSPGAFGPSVGPLWRVEDGLDVVSIDVENECRVVVTAVFGRLPGRAVVGSPET